MDLPDTPTADVQPDLPRTRTRRVLLGAGLAGVATLLPRFGTTAGASAPPTSDETNTATEDTEPELDPEGDGPSPGTDPATEPAATTTTAPPRRPTAADDELLNFAQGIELAIVKCYEVALDGEALDDTARGVVGAILQSHQSYGQAFRGLAGDAVRGQASPEVLDAFADRFGGADQTEVLAAAYELEATALATHTELVRTLEGLDGSALVASMLLVEARHCTVLAHLAGEDELDVLLLSDADALEAPRG